MVNALKVSFKNLQRNTLRSFLATIGIILGTLAITALLSLGFGLQTSIQAQFENAGGELIQVTPKSIGGGPPGTNAVDALTEDDLDVVSRATGVQATAGRLIKQARVSYDDTEEGAFITSLPERTESRELIATQLDFSIAQGRMIRPGETGIVIGSSYAEATKENPLRVRDTVRIQNETFEVVGVLQETGRFVVDQAILMNEDNVRDTFAEPDAYDLIIAQPADDVNTVKASIQRELRRDRDVDPGDETFDVQTNQEALQSITSILQILSGVLAAIGGISLVLGGITIMNTMYTTVLERTQEIGVMKSVGAKRRDITVLFVVEAGMLGLVGGLVGSILGFGTAASIAYVARTSLGIPFFEALLAPWVFLAGTSFATITGLLSGYAPARRAAKKDPVEALRG